MKKLLIILNLILIVNFSSARSVDEKTAFTVAEKFFQMNLQSSYKSAPLLSLAYKCTAKQTNNYKSTKSEVYYYVFNNGDKGFIIVAGDDASSPVLGYSTESSFDINKLPSNVAKWLEGYKVQIQYIIENNISQTNLISQEWDNILKGEPNLNSTKSAVLPLVKTKWDQSPYVNEQCPYDSNEKDYAVTGCPATAMAQIMKYWKHPKVGTGFHSYNSKKFGTLSANFGSTTYDWDKMPDVVNSPNEAVALLMYHCGVSVEMNYAVDGSSSFVILNGNYPKERTVENALKTYFDYASTIQGLMRENFSDSEWKLKLKSELDAARPIQYVGFGKGGHTWVCDGYDNNDYFHMNWGWGGYYDGYYLLNNLVPGTGGTGAGSGSYNNDQQALIGIKPAVSTSSTYKLELVKDVVSDKSSISYLEDFTITTDIRNNGTAAFVGEFCAAAFDASNVFVDYIKIIPDDLSPGYHYTNGIKFKSDGMISLMPGNYKVSIYHKATNNEKWTLIRPASSDLTTKYSTSIQVTNKNDICLYAQMALTPKTNIYKGDPFSVWLDVANYTTDNFKGDIDVSLYSLEGDFVTTIGTKTGLTLSANSHYSNGLTFSTNALDAPPGTYLLVVFHKWDGYDWEMTGSSRYTGSSTTTYSNPIKIIVQSKPLSPDIYENNDQLIKAFDLTTSFSGNVATKKTTGSNIHSGTDVDYYKFSLSTGYDYKISARLQDEYSSNDGKNYTVDCAFSYSLDGTNWSDDFDDLMTSDISVSGPKTVYIFVSPYFPGETGTYQLDLSISRLVPNYPILSTTAITAITTTTANSGGNITSSGGTSITARGVCWSTSSNPTTANIKTSNGTGTGVFSSALTGLTSGTTYYVKAYATNSAGTAYGNEIMFTTTSSPAVLTTNAISSITATTAISGGVITSSGGSSITAKGVCWSKTSGPTVSGSKTTDGTGTGNFTSSLSGLTPATQYYVRAYATNISGTSYGNEISFTTTSALPTLTTATVSSIALTTASCGGNITYSGGSSITARGVCWSINSGPTTASNKTSDGNGTGSFSSTLSNLVSGTTYYVRAYATNSSGTAYGNEVTFKTLATIPTVSTISASSVTTTTATSGGNITSDGGATITARGVCWNTNSNPTTANSKTSNGTGSGQFSSSLSGLNSNTTYYIRAYATNSVGTAYGNELSFKTSGNVPTIETSSVSAITSTTATSGGNITSDGGLTITTRGVCWSLTSSPTTANSKTTDGSGVGSFTSSITSLIAGSRYYVRAYATNSAGTAYGNEVSFSTIITGISDYENDGANFNVYPNPASDYINVDVLGSNLDFSKINIADLAGKIIYSSEFKNMKFIRIPLTNFRSGTYFLNLTGDLGVSITKKIIIKK